MPDWILMLFWNHLDIIVRLLVGSSVDTLDFFFSSLKGYKDRSTHKTQFSPRMTSSCALLFSVSSLRCFVSPAIFKKMQTDADEAESFTGVRVLFLSLADKFFLKGTCSWWSSWVFSPWSLLQCVLAYNISKLTAGKGWRGVTCDFSAMFSQLSLGELLWWVCPISAFFID